MMGHHRQRETVGQKPVDGHRCSVSYGEMTLRSQPYALADRILRVDACEMLVLRDVDMRVFDRLLGDGRRFHLE